MNVRPRHMTACDSALPFHTHFDPSITTIKSEDDFLFARTLTPKSGLCPKKASASPSLALTNPCQPAGVAPTPLLKPF